MSDSAVRHYPDNDPLSVELLSHPATPGEDAGEGPRHPLRATDRLAGSAGRSRRPCLVALMRSAETESGRALLDRRLRRGPPPPPRDTRRRDRFAA